MKTAIAKLRSFVYASQEFTLWLPGLVVLSVLGFVFLGSFVKLGGDAIAWLAELPVLCAYAAAWLGCGWLIKAVYMHDIPRAKEVELQAKALAGDTSAQWLIRQDRIETFVALLLALAFFWPPR